MNRSTKSFLLFKSYLFSFLHTCMFPACCFPPTAYVAQGHVNGAPNETRTHSCMFDSRIFFSICMGLYRGLQRKE